MASILVPVAYLIIVFGGLFLFSHFYRKHTSSPYTLPLLIPNSLIMQLSFSASI